MRTLLALSALCVGLGIVPHSAAIAAADDRCLAMVRVEKRCVEATIQGAGRPAVVFEAGFTGGQTLWKAVRDKVAQQTLTLTYERAGLGRSDPGPEPRSAKQIARELHALLKATKLPPPYIVVGHSAGGMYVRVFAHMYPKDVAGLVLVDPATEDFYSRMLAERSAEDVEKMGAPRGAVQQWRALTESLDQASHSWPLPSVPTIIFTSAKPLGSWPLESAEDMRRFGESQLHLASQIPDSQHIAVQDTDHLSILRADVISEQILKLIGAYRADFAR